jgi:hypothetical protein
VTGPGRIWFRVPPQFVAGAATDADYVAACRLALDDDREAVVWFTLRSYPDDDAVPADALAAIDELESNDDAERQRVDGGTATITHDVVPLPAPDLAIAQDTAFVRRAGSAELHVLAVATSDLDARLPCADLLAAILDTVTFSRPAVTSDA